MDEKLVEYCEGVKAKWHGVLEKSIELNKAKAEELVAFVYKECGEEMPQIVYKRLPDVDFEPLTRDEFVEFRDGFEDKRDKEYCDVIRQQISGVKYYQEIGYMFHGNNYKNVYKEIIKDYRKEFANAIVAFDKFSYTDAIFWDVLKSLKDITGEIVENEFCDTFFKMILDSGILAVIPCKDCCVVYELPSVEEVKDILENLNG